MNKTRLITPLIHLNEKIIRMTIHDIYFFIVVNFLFGVVAAAYTDFM